MDKSTLKQIRHLKSEIEHLSKMAEKASTPVHDVVKGSSAEYPYTQHVIHVEGINEPEVGHKLRKINKKIKDKAQELITLRAEAVDWIMAIEDSQVRQIFMMRYVEGWKWEKISRCFGSDYGEYAQRIHDRYLKGLENDS